MFLAYLGNLLLSTVIIIVIIIIVVACVLIATNIADDTEASHSLPTVGDVQEAADTTRIG